MSAPVKATTTRSLPTDQSILLCGAVLVFASATIPFWPYTGSMLLKYTLKPNARGGPTALLNRQYDDVSNRRITRSKAVWPLSRRLRVATQDYRV